MDKTLDQVGSSVGRAGCYTARGRSMAAANPTRQPGMQKTAEAGRPELRSASTSKQTGNRSRVFLADPALCSHRGHYFNFVHCLVEPLQARGHEVHVLSNRFIEPDLRSQLPTFPTFTYGHSHQDWEHFPL